MSASECRHRITEISSRLEFNSKIVGRLLLSDAQYDRCANCQKVLSYTGATSLMIEHAVNEEIKRRLGLMPISSMVGVQDACALLGITRQALHGNKRRLRLIHHIYHNNQLFLWKDSLEAFHRTGNGRIFIPKYVLEREPEVTVSGDLAMIEAVDNLTVSCSP